MTEPTPDLLRQICARGRLDQKTVRNYFRSPQAVRESSRLRVEQALAELEAESAVRPQAAAITSRGLPRA